MDCLIARGLASEYFQARTTKVHSNSLLLGGINGHHIYDSIVLKFNGHIKLDSCRPSHKKWSCQVNTNKMFQIHFLPLL